MADHDHTKDFKLIWVATVPRTGSMWCYNITRAILKELGYNVFPDQIPQLDKSMFGLADAGIRDPNPLNIWTLKIHSRLRCDVPRSRIVSTFRDPRDSMISFMRFMRCDFDRALGATVHAIGYYDYIREFPAEVLLCLKYRDIVDRPHEPNHGHLRPRVELGLVRPRRPQPNRQRHTIRSLPLPLTHPAPHQPTPDQPKSRTLQTPTSGLCATWAVVRATLAECGARAGVTEPCGSLDTRLVLAHRSDRRSVDFGALATHLHIHDARINRHSARAPMPGREFCVN